LSHQKHHAGLGREEKEKAYRKEEERTNGFAS
jgi:hypothetical protein